MINIENILFDSLYTKLNTHNSDITVLSKDMNIPTSFPAVSIVEIDNYTHTNSLDSSLTENYSNVVYEVNVYSNKPNGNKSEAKAIFAVIDGVFSSSGFIRKSVTPIVMEESTIYRLVGRYSGLVSNNKKIYRR